MTDFFNFDLQKDNISNQVHVISLTYSNGSCALYGACSKPMPTGLPGNVVETYSENIMNYGFFVGCFAFEALLQATLECFYNQTCVTDILLVNTGTIEGTKAFANISILNVTDPWSNETSELVVSLLLVDLWLPDISFTSYYNA
jgi:hypothetical protein